MKNKQLYSNPILWYFILSILFVVVNVISFEWKLAWNDETELTDTSANFVEFGQWISRAYPDYGGKVPFSIYVPLHQMLLALWMKIFGFSMISARSFNLLLTFSAGWGLLTFVKRLLKKNSNSISVFIFALLFWGCAEFAFIYRNGRGDMLGVLLCVMLANYVFDYISTKNKTLLYVISFLSGLLIWSALQACIFAVAALLFVIAIYYKEYKNEFIKVAIYMFIGFVVGFALMMLFFWYNDHLFPFLVSIASLSGTLKSVAASLLPYVGPTFGLNPEEWLAKLADDEVGPSIFEKILSIYDFITYDILLAVLIFILLLKRSNIEKPQWRHPVVLFLLFVILVPVFMNFAGRYVEYYRWMSYLPLVVSLIIFVELFEKKYITKGVLLVAFIISAVGVFSMFDKEQKEKNDAIKLLCQRLPVNKSDVVCAPDEFFYEIRKKSNECYFTKHYPVKYLDVNSINFYIKNKNDFETKHNTKFSRQLQKALDENPSIRLMPVDSCELLKVVVYKVEHN